MTHTRLLALALVLAACGSEPAPAEATPPTAPAAPARETIHVLAAASLADVLPPIARELDASGVAVELQFGASSTLAQQIERGAPCDAFVAADPRWAQHVIDARLADATSRAVIATNRLVAIVPADAASTPATLAEVAALPHVAVAGPEVPAGAHARTALERSGALATAEPHLVNAPDVRGALAWVARGEAEAGLVYATDARVEPRVRVAFEVPSDAHEPIRYEAVTVSREPGGAPSAAARRFVDHLRSESAQRQLAAAGFGPPG